MISAVGCASDRLLCVLLPGHLFTSVDASGRVMAGRGGGTRNVGCTSVGYVPH